MTGPLSRARALRRKALRARNDARNARLVAAGYKDARGPMQRLLEDCANSKGEVQVESARQWPTMSKAIRLGYVTDYPGAITDKGREYLAKCRAETAKVAP